VRLQDEMKILQCVIQETRVREGCRRRPPDDDYACFISEYMTREPVQRRAPGGSFRHKNYLPCLFISHCLYEIPIRCRTVAKDLEFLGWVAVWFSTASIEE